MENREDLDSIIGFLPVILGSSSLFWPLQVVEALKSLSKGPDHSKVDSDEILFLVISDIRQSLKLSDDLMPREEANKWFEEVLPTMADLLLRFPSMLEAHYKNADSVTCVVARDGLQMGLHLLKSQEAGIALLSQELIGGLLACSFFCLFLFSIRGADKTRFGLYQDSSTTSSVCKLLKNIERRLDKLFDKLD
ncbi:poly(ADP-ribose) glycohydrolase 1-like protein isoform X2 [Tanacetum coccineum]